MYVYTSYLIYKYGQVHGGHLAHIFDVFERLGFATTDTRNDGEKWHVLWHHDYPFGDRQLSHQLQRLQYYQRVNHVPGSGYYTSKVYGSNEII
jgi:tubulin monoglycylase TTLL15